MPISNELTKAIHNHLNQFDSSWDELDALDAIARQMTQWLSEKERKALAERLRNGDSLTPPEK